MTEEVGKGLSVPDVTPDAQGKIRVPVLYRINGTEEVDGKELLKFEMHRADTVTNTDLLSVDEHGITCWARINLDGDLIKLNPPQRMIATPLRRGARWNFDGQAGDLRVRQRYHVTGEEQVHVPAGKFRAFHVHAVQRSPTSTVIDRWFVAGIGIVKDVTTTRASSGDLLERISLELAELPKNTERPQVNSDAVPKRISISVAKERFGETITTFSWDTRRIYTRWQGYRLRLGAKIRAVWIGENIGEEFPPDYKIDEASTVAESSTAHGVFTLTRPEGGWVPGDYRVEFYLDDVFVDAVKLKIVK